MSRNDKAQRPDCRWGWYRRLDLVGPDGRTFLRRRGLDISWGILLHRLDAPDPGIDLHDHPWPFISIVLRGGYLERFSEARDASRPPGLVRRWDRWSIHRMPLSSAHRIIGVAPNTVTLVLRGRKVRMWGFFMPDGWVPWTDYDYDARRPLTVHSNKAVDETVGGRPDE